MTKDQVTHQQRLSHRLQNQRPTVSFLLNVANELKNKISIDSCWGKRHLRALPRFNLHTPLDLKQPSANRNQTLFDFLQFDQPLTFSHRHLLIRRDRAEQTQV